MKSKWYRGYRGDAFRLFLVILLLSSFIPAGGALAEATLLKTGNYYYSPAPNAGNSPDNGATGLVSSEGGVLLDGLTKTYAGWMGSATAKGTVQAVFDLQRD
ncbi:hypothetical protein AB4Z21_36890, partial [Paenibacillus sp. MCAF20]